MVMTSREKQALGWNISYSHWLAACARHVGAIFSKKFVQGFGDGSCFLPLCCDHSQNDLEAWAATFAVGTCSKGRRLPGAEQTESDKSGPSAAELPVPGAKLSRLVVPRLGSS